MANFNPKEYWESRLNKSFDLVGVGDINLGDHYNKCLYDIRKFAFHKVMNLINVDFSKNKVLDIGSGTGFYIDRWSELGVESINGTDITNVVVNKLGKKYPEHKFNQLDIGEKIDSAIPTYDFISAFDVLFHIVDDSRFEQSIKNIHGLLNENGHFVISDNFIRFETIRLEHQVIRSDSYMTEVIEAAGFFHVKTKPMFVLMNDPVDTKNRVIKKIFWLIVKGVRKSEKRAKFIGFFVVPLEKILISLMKESPSTEIKVYQKR